MISSVVNDDHCEHTKTRPYGLYVRGAKGLKLRDQRVRVLVRRMRHSMPWLEEADSPMCRAWAELEVLANRVYAELRDRQLLTAKKSDRAVRLLNDYRQLRATQAIYFRQLGMSPESRMQIKATGTRTAFDLAAEIALARQSQDVQDSAISDSAAETVASPTDHPKID